MITKELLIAFFVCSFALTSIRKASAQEVFTLAGQFPPAGEKVEVLVGANFSVGGETKNKIYPGNIQRYFWVDVSAMIDPDARSLSELFIRLTPHYAGTRYERSGVVLSEKGMMSTPIEIERHVDLGLESKLAIYYLGANFEFRDVESEAFFARAVVSALGAHWMILNTQHSYLGFSLTDAFLEGGIELSKWIRVPFDARVVGGIRQEISAGTIISEGFAAENRSEFYGRVEIQLSENYEAWGAAGLELQSWTRGKDKTLYEKFIRAGISVHIR